MGTITLPHRPQGGDTRVIAHIIANLDAILAQANGNLEASTNVKVGVAASTLDGNSNAEGTASALARIDHLHKIQGVERLAAEPVSGHFIGRLYYNTVTLRLMVCYDDSPASYAALGHYDGATGAMLYATADAQQFGSTAAPTDGQVLRSVGAVPTWLASHLGYSEETTSVTINTTTSATAVLIVSLPALTYAAVPTEITVSVPSIERVQVASGSPTVMFGLYDGGAATGIARLGEIQAPTTLPLTVPFERSYKFVPSAGSHTYQLRAYANTADDWIAQMGAGGNDVRGPAFIRAVRL